VEVYFDPAGLTGGTTTLRIYRLSDDRTWLVRGGVDVAPGTAPLDFECPFGVNVQYRAEMFNTSGVSLGFTDSTSITLDVSDVWVHNPLAPAGGVNLGPNGILDGSFGAVSRPTVGGAVYVEGASVGRHIGAVRRGIVGARLGFACETVAVADGLQAMLGSYETQRVGVVCVRTPPPLRVPRTLFASVGDPTEVDGDVAWGGERTDFWFVVDEVAPPFPGLVVPLLSYEDLDLAFASYTTRDAGFATYTLQDRAYEYSGLSDQ
jgi:hypothetical protein